MKKRKKEPAGAPPEEIRVEKKRLLRVFPFPGGETGAEALALIPTVSGARGGAAIGAFYLALAERFFREAEELLFPAARLACEQSRLSPRERFSRPAARLEVSLREKRTVRGHPALVFSVEYALFVRGRAEKSETSCDLWLADRGILARGEKPKMREKTAKKDKKIRRERLQKK
ncbi:MAG: hypothetical protein IJR89_09320 [Clostridia bacterium]|nr:hypothetical protein [Clostridia bacterium]